MISVIPVSSLLSAFRSVQRSWVLVLSCGAKAVSATCAVIYIHPGLVGSIEIRNMSNKAELACVYSALILVDDDVAVTVSVRSV